MSAFFTASARLVPRARLYSVEPRSSQCPSIVMWMFACCCRNCASPCSEPCSTRSNVVLVVVEVDVLHGSARRVLLRWRRSRCWRRSGRSVDSHASGRVLRASRAFRDQMIGGRVGWGHLARAAGFDRADTVDADIGGVGGLPRQGRRMALVDECSGSQTARRSERWAQVAAVVAAARLSSRMLPRNMIVRRVRVRGCTISSLWLSLCFT